MKKKIIKYLREKLVESPNKNKIAKDVILNDNVKTLGSEIKSASIINDGSKILFSKIGRNCSIGKNNLIEASSIANDFVSNQKCKIYKSEVIGKVSMGRFSSLWGPNIDITASEEQKIKIGSFCSISRNVTMQISNHNHKKLTTYFIGKNLFEDNWINETVSKGDIVVENDVWIGSHCVILGGVTIGNGAIIAANSVVTKDVPEYSIVAGSPAKVISYRFNEEVREKLAEIKWWNWELGKLERNKHLFREELTLDMLNNINE